MNTIPVSCRLLKHGSDLPTYQSALAAGADLRAALQLKPYNGSLVLPAGDFAKVPTALQIALPPNYEAQIRPRSGLAAKHGIALLNAPGTIDADYRGEIFILLINHGKKDFWIRHGDRIAQIVISPIIRARFLIQEELSKTERDTGGFGSSGTN